MISIIIPTFNEEKYLPILLSCIKDQTYKDYEVIVADANSTDKTKEMAIEFGARVVEGGIPGIGRNNGTKKAQGEVLLFIDSDVRFENDFIEKVLTEFKTKNLDFAIPYFHTKNESKRLSLFFKNANIYKKVMQHTRFPDGTGQFFIAKKSVFEKLGGFSDYQVAEDTDLAWRAARKKYKVGTVSPRFYSSTRRLEKVGILWISSVWLLIGIFFLFGVIKRKSIQEFSLKLYGGWGNRGIS